ncbi:hypothetical protein QQ045_031174 [Rhodiola kirilowii]
MFLRDIIRNDIANTVGYVNLCDYNIYDRRNMAKIKAVVDQETWVEVDVPEEFQTIVNCLFGVASSTTKSTSDSRSLPRPNVDTEKASSDNVLESTDSVASMNEMKN